MHFISFYVEFCYARKSFTLVISSDNVLTSFFTNMKVTQNHALSSSRLAEMALIGGRLARLRISRHMTQAEAAVRAGLSRNTAYRLEKGDAGLAVGQVLRYLEAIAPGKSLLELLQADDPALTALEAGEKRKRVRSLSKEELNKLDF